MINFKDFTGLKESTFFISQDEKQATIDMNEWIENNTVSIMSIETIVKEYRFVCVRLCTKRNVEDVVLNIIKMKILKSKPVSHRTIPGET